MTAPASGATIPTTENCRFCWMCRHACPVGHVTHRETYTPHAWALTIESVKRGQLRWNQETAEVLYACADCGLCRAHCVTDQPLPDAIVQARAEVVAAGVAPAAVIALDERLRRQGSEHGAPSPAVQKVSGAGLFVGDAHHLNPAGVEAAVRLLRAAGADATPLCVGRSTGSVAASLGLHATAASLARTIVDELESAGVQELIVLTPADRWTFEYVYPRRLGVSMPAKLVIRDVVTILANACVDGRLAFAAADEPEAYAYHDPCHTPRVHRDGRAPHVLLEAAIGARARRLFWREGRAHPCGAVGGLEYTHPQVAASLADARLADAARAGAAWFVTEDAACARHLGQRNGPIKVVDLFTLLHERLSST